MMSVEVLIAVNNEIARKAAREGLVPYVPSSADEVESPFTFPNIGSLEASGLAEDRRELVRGQMGHGLDWEPALTWRQFRRQLAGYLLRHPDHGFAITEEGECQVVVSAFRRV